MLSGASREPPCAPSKLKPAANSVRRLETGAGDLGIRAGCTHLSRWRESLRTACMKPQMKLSLRFPALVTAYIAGAWISLSVAFVHGTVSPVWPLTGLAIASLVLWGSRLWPAVALAALVTNTMIAGNPWPVASGIAFGNTLEATFGAFVLRRLGVTGEVSRVRDAIALIAVAIVAPLPSATGGVLSLTFSGLSPPDQMFWVWLAWWLGDFMGALLIVPLLLSWFGDQVPVPLPKRPIEFAGALATAVALVSFVFLRPDALSALGVPYLPLSSFLFPPIVWAVLRLRPRETTMVVLTACGTAVAYTVAFTEAEMVGRLLWLQMVLLCIGGGSLLMVGAMAERARAQQDLLVNEVRFRTIFEQAAVGIAQIGRDGRFLEVNSRLCQMLDYRREELLEKTFEEVTLPTYRERRALGELLAGRRPSHVLEKQYIRKDGTPVWARLTSSLPDETDSYRISIIEDITRQQQAMAALKEAHAQLQFALEGAQAGLWEWDIVSDRITGTDMFYRTTGVDGSTPMSFETWLSHLVPQDRSAVSQIITTTLQRNETRVRVEYRVQHPGKGLCWLMGVGQVTYDGQSPVKMVGLNVEITDLKRAEEEARAADRAKCMFLAAASHDLRQPVQAMVLLFEALSIRLQGHPAHHLLPKIGSSLEAMQRLLGGLLEVSRLDAGLVTPNMQLVPLAPIVEDLVSEYALRMAKHGVVLKVVRPAGWTCTDPALLQQILHNLLENALKFTERGRVLIGCRRTGDRIRLHVIDSGIGIAPEHKDMIFQEFYQVDNPERDREKGLGLGLSIVKRLCLILDHRIDFTSLPGRGTCFTVDLPAVQADTRREGRECETGTPVLGGAAFTSGERARGSDSCSAATSSSSARHGSLGPAGGG